MGSSDAYDRLATVENILAQQTTSLDTIVKNTSDWRTEMTVLRNRMERYEGALKAVTDKLGLHFEL